MTNSNNKWWKPIVHFAAHVLSGSILFIIIGAPAVGLSLLVSFLKAYVSAFTINVLEFLEHFILICDVFLFIVYLVTVTYKDIKEWYK
jgi:hypothetical protein